MFSSKPGQHVAQSHMCILITSTGLEFADII